MVLIATSLYWVPICSLNLSIWVIWTVIYIVESKFILNQYANPVRTYYVVSELENAVDIVERINTLNTWRYLCELFCWCVVTWFAIYLCDWIHHNNVLFTPPCRLISEKNHLKNNSLSLPVKWQSIRVLETWCRCMMLVPPIDHLFVISNIFSLCSYQIFDTSLRTELTSQILFSYFHHWIIWAPSSSVYSSIVSSGFIFISHPDFPPISSIQCSSY